MLYFLCVAGHAFHQENLHANVGTRQGLAQDEARSQESHLGLPHGWQVLKYLRRYLLLCRMNYKEAKSEVE